jgi:hypothetical protein
MVDEDNDEGWFLSEVGSEFQRRDGVYRIYY